MSRYEDFVSYENLSLAGVARAVMRDFRDYLYANNLKNIHAHFPKLYSTMWKDGGLSLVGTFEFAAISSTFGAAWIENSEIREALEDGGVYSLVDGTYTILPQLNDVINAFVRRHLFEFLKDNNILTMRPYEKMLIFGAENSSESPFVIQDNKIVPVSKGSEFAPIDLEHVTFSDLIMLNTIRVGTLKGDSYVKKSGSGFVIFNSNDASRSTSREDTIFTVEEGRRRKVVAIYPNCPTPQKYFVDTLSRHGGYDVVYGVPLNTPFNVGLQNIAVDSITVNGVEFATSDFLNSGFLLGLSAVDDFELITNTVGTTLGAKDEDRIYGFNRVVNDTFRLQSYKGVWYTEAQLDSVRYAELGITGVKQIGDKSIYIFDEKSIDNYNAASANDKQVMTTVGSYSFRPNKMVFLKHDDEDKPLYLGCEIEMDGGGRNDGKHATIFSGAFSNYRPHAWFMHDGSLHNGIEMATVPATLRAHQDESLMNYKKLFKVARYLKYTANDNDTCGLHIHVSRKFFTYPELAYSFMVLFLKLNWDSVLDFTRRKHRDGHITYAVLSQDWLSISKETFTGGKIKKLLALNNKLELIWLSAQREKNKYAAINVLHNDTFEFRIFKGTLNYDAYMATLEFVDGLCRFAEDWTVKFHALINSDSLDNIDDEVINTPASITIKEISDKIKKKHLSSYVENIAKYKNDGGDE